MKLPKSINILGVTYKIKEVKVVNKHTPRNGEINFCNQTIKIDKSLPDDKKRQVLLHEILHGICELLGMDDIGDDEHVIQSLATALHHVLFTQTIFS